MIDQSVYAFSPDNPPFQTVQPGELLTFRTMDCFSNKIREASDLVCDFDYSQANPAAGPVFVAGAEPGDVLVVDILDIQVADRGVITTLPGCGPLHQEQETRTKVVPIRNGKALFNDIEFPIQPMVGVIGVAPGEGKVVCGYPGQHGGNMDCKLITKGARLYFPVRTPGALLAMGDIHAAMGDGELCGTGIEIAGQIAVKTALIKQQPLEWPVLETADKWYVIACAAEYPTALRLASLEMQRLMGAAYGWDVTDCYLYLSVQGDVEICQACKPCSVDLILRLGVPKLPGREFFAPV